MATADQPFHRVRPEDQTPDLGFNQTAQELSLRRAAEMENGRARNIYTIV
jgi:hypothetical protein